MRPTTTAAAPLALLLCLIAPAAAETATALQNRIARDAQRLSSDDFGGRGLGEPGLERAAQYIRRRFTEIGLQTNALDGDAFQPFNVTVSTEIGKDNHASFVGLSKAGEPVLTEFKLDKDYTPMAIGGAGEFSLPVAFVGYGITAPEANYDDYAGIDVTGKAVVILRHEPQQANPHSAFNGTEHSRHAPFRAKVSNAAQHGAAAIIFTTDAYEIDQRVKQWTKRITAAEQELADATGKRQARLQNRIRRFKDDLAQERDPLLAFRRAGVSLDRELPVLSLRPSVIDRMLALAGKPTLRELESQIDKALKPASFDLPEVQLVGKTDIEREKKSVANVLGVLPGQGDHADEIVVVGAHYDHLGRGGKGSTKPESNEIHNGADDNASGVAALLATSRLLASDDQRHDRTLVFIAFTGEERGLLGSAHYTKEPLYPLESTVAMVNFDMVGRLRNNELTINGVGTATEFKPLVESTNASHGFSLATTAGGYGPSDHASFYAQKVPVMHFFTGLHDEYHQPEDDFELLNLTGINRVSKMAAEVIAQLADGDTAITYAEVEGPSMPAPKTDPRPYFGSIPDFTSDGTGYAITGVAADSPAADAGLQGGDRIIQLGEFKISNLEDFDNALRKFVAGDKAKVIVVRAGAEVTLEVVLDPPK